MAKPTIVTRASKGSALTWTEGDANITNLQNATIAIKAGSAGVSVTADLNSEIVLVAGTNITLTGDNTGKTITIDATGGGATTLDELSDVVITAAATNDVLVYNGTNWVDTALSSVTVGTATTCQNLNISTTNGNAGDATMFVVLAPGLATGNALAHIDSTLAYNASTDTLSSTNFSGALNGTVGATTASTGAFTTLTTSGAVTLSPANAAVAISPTGTGTVAISPAGALTINPTTASTINNTSIGATTASTGRFTTVTSTVATGTAPFTVASQTLVSNLNVALLDGQNWNSPGIIGNVTAQSGRFTTLSATTGINSTIIGATTPAAGTFTTMTAATSVLDDIRETVFAGGTTTGTITPDAANGSVQTLTLTGSITLNAFANPVSGQSITLIITQSASGNNTLTSTMKFAGGSKTLSTAANAIDILTVSYIGTTYYASLAKGFA